MSQRLVLPFRKTTLISASYKNTAYQQSWGFPHYGLDCGSAEAGYDVFACGNGIVVSAGLNNGAINKGLGNCIVIKYSNVKCNDGVVRNLACRMFHFDRIYVKAGQAVTPKTILGLYGNSGGYYDASVSAGRHLHIEFGTDYNSPTKSIGIAPASSGIVVQQTKTDISIDPSIVWSIGKGQSIKGCTIGWFSNKDVNLPKVTDKILKTKNTNGQKLILPVNNATITAGYKNSKYRTMFGFSHFGLDLIGQSTIYASGNGIVLACGYDNILGNVIAVKYENVYNHKTQKSFDIVMRYNHLESIKVRSNQKVDKDTVLGIMGNTGKYSAGKHLHIEVDTDAMPQYACWTPTLSGNSNIMKAGTDSTINPAEILHVKTSAPDRQSVKRLYDGYSTDADSNIEIIQ